MTNSVPPEAGSAFGAELSGGGFDGYYTREQVINELMCWFGKSEPAAEEQLAELGAEQAIEAIQSQIRP